MNELAAKHCTPCRGGVPPLSGVELEEFERKLPFWKVIQEHHIEKTFLFPDFVTALDFVVRIGGVAEEQGHHPDVCLSWGKVDVKIFTHKIRGLSENDFILAAKIDKLMEP